MTQAAGTLYLIPVPLGPEDDPVRVLPPATIAATTGLDYFVAENARSARAVLGRLPMQRPIQQIEIRELNQRTAPGALEDLLAPLRAGRDCGLVSEAGCPAVADPGAALVALAHRAGVRVTPLIGPSALLLALMASGMNGQAFSFTGYVPVEPAQRAARLKALEGRSAENAETILMIETPYRNQVLFDEMLRALRPDTTVTVCAELTLPGEQVRSRTVAEWRAQPAVLEREPAVFALQAAPRAPRQERVNEAARARRRR